MDIEKEIEALKERNKKVEQDKKWERSPTRIIAICVLTYLIVLVYSVFLNKSGNVYLSSAVPVIGFFLSTLSVNFVKKLWRHYEFKNKTK